MNNPMPNEGLEPDTGPDSADPPSCTELSASQKLSQWLSLGRARDLEEQAWSVIPKILDGLGTYCIDGGSL